MPSSHTYFSVNKHELPIGQMGNYQEHLKKINPLRELDSGSVRTQLFGNPFKLEKPDKVCPKHIQGVLFDLINKTTFNIFVCGYCHVVFMHIV